MKITTLTGFAFLLIFSTSCSVNKLALKKADKKFKYAEYELAIEGYEKLIEKNYMAGFSNFKIGESYRLSNRLKDSETFYKAALNAGYKEDPAYIYYAASLKVNEKYNDSRHILEDYLDIGEDESYVKLANEELDNIILITDLKDKKSFYRVKNLDMINSEAAEYSPVYLNGELYFTSNRSGGKEFKTTGTPFTELYKAKTRGAVVDTESIKPIPGNINSPNANVGTITFSPDGNTMVFAKGYNGKKKSMEEVNLYSSTFRRGQWSDPRRLRISDLKSWDSSPTFSRDGNSIVFASNRNGGFGGIDLYVATKNRRGRFSNPRNLGEKINTAGNEMFPHLGQSGELYFASNGHPGLGGLDIFVSRRVGGKQVIENLGSPINTSSDDFSMYMYSPTKGFLASNRPGGKGDDDIYTFINNDPDLKIVNYYLIGTVVTLNDELEEQAVSNAFVKIFDADNQLRNEAVTGRDGKFRFRVYPEENYSLVADKVDYITNRGDFSTIGETIPKSELKKLVTNKTFSTKIQIDQVFIEQAIVMENIYYDLDKSFIRDDAAKELDKLVVLLEDNPGIEKMELSSHTDNRNTVVYNLDLSERRAESAVEYIISKGIDPSRIIAKGYGESEPFTMPGSRYGILKGTVLTEAYINELSGEVQERAHQLNRRSEFKILEYVQIVEREEEDVVDDQQAQTETASTPEDPAPKKGRLKFEKKVESDDDLENRIDWDN